MLYVDPALETSAPKRWWHRYTLPLARWFASAPVLNGAATSTERADWTSVGCVLLYQQVPHIITHASGEYRIFPLATFLAEKRVQQCAVRALHVANSTDMTPKLLQLFIELSGQTFVRPMNPETDQCSLVAELYWMMTCSRLDVDDPTQTPSDLFGTGGALDRLLYEHAARNFQLAPEICARL